MNDSEFVKILRISDEPTCRYAADRIERLNLQVRETAKRLGDLQEDVHQLVGWLKGHKGEPVALGIESVVTAILMSLKPEI